MYYYYLKFKFFFYQWFIFNKLMRELVISSYYHKLSMDYFYGIVRKVLMSLSKVWNPKRKMVSSSFETRRTSINPSSL